MNRNATYSTAGQHALIHTRPEEEDGAASSLSSKNEIASHITESTLVSALQAANHGISLSYHRSQDGKARIDKLSSGFTELLIRRRHVLKGRSTRGLAERHPKVSSPRRRLNACHGVESFKHREPIEKEFHISGMELIAETTGCLSKKSYNEISRIEDDSGFEDEDSIKVNKRRLKRKRRRVN